MKVIFDGITEVQHIHGVFRMPKEVVELTEAVAQDVIGRGLASPWGHTAIESPPRTVAMNQRQVLVKKAVCLWVVVPTAGGRAGDLDRTIAALVLNAPHRTFINVVLDGDCTETERVVAWWLSHLSKNKCVTFSADRTTGKVGPNMARDLAIRKAPGHAVIVEVDDHDQPEPGALGKIGALFRDSEAEATYAAYYDVDRLGRLVREQRKAPYQHGLFCESCPSRGLRAYRKRLYEAVGGYRKDEYPAGDHWLWLRFAEHLKHDPKKLHYIDTPLARWKRCEKSICVTHEKEQLECSQRAVLAAITGTLFPRKDKTKEPSERGLPDYSSVKMAHVGESELVRDTSIVIPCYRSTKYVPGLLESLRPEERHAVTLVSNGDGEYTGAHVSQVVLSHNTGFAHACNVGAKQTKSKYICFLNADVIVKDGWLAGMIDELESACDIAIVGNRQFDGRGRIHSCGSHWSWGTNHFEHDCRGQEARNQREWAQARDLDVITASCILVRRDIFEEVGGFDERYRIGYWEDSDLCMKVRQAGYRIRFTPKSTITHFCNSSGGVRHPHYADNAKLCRKRWVETGLVDKFARQRGERVHDGAVVACYIVLNEEEYIQASLESIYNFVDRIIIVEGGNEYAVAGGLCGKDKQSTDQTVERIESFPDPAHKIQLIRGAWKDKTEQRQAYASRLKPGDWMLLMDGDEVFYDAGLWRLSYLMHRHDIIMPGFDLFWHDFNTLGTGEWDRYPQLKVAKWRQGYRYTNHNVPTDGKGGGLAAKAHRTRERLYAHYAWVKPIKKLQQKVAYYQRQPGARERIRPDYIDKVFLAYGKAPLATAQMFGTHPFGGGAAAMFTGKHPESIARRLAAGELKW